MGFTSSGISYTTVSGARATSNVGSSAAMRDVQKAMVTYQPYQNPILARLMTQKYGKKPTGNQKFEWVQSSLLPRTDTITLVGGATSEDNITVGDSTLYQVGTKLVVDSTGQVVIVDKKTGSQVDVTKVGSGNITAVSSATAHFMGDSFEQGSSSAVAKSVNKDFPYNYVEIFKKSCQETRSQKAIVEYGEEDWMRNVRDRMTEFKLDLEASFFHGVRTTATGYQNASFTQYFTGGAFDPTAAFIGTGYTYSGVNPGEDYFFNTFLKGLFAKGSGRKALFCGADLKSTITNYSKVKQQTKVEETKYGANIRTIECDFGLLDIQWHPMLDGNTFTKWGVALDMEGDYVKYRYLAGNGENRDINFEEFPHIKEQDSTKAQWIGEIGWQIEGNDYHGTLKPAIT